MEAFEHLQVSVTDGVALVVLNRPQILNALAIQTFRELLSTIGALDADPAVRVVVFTGAGDRAFCAGSDPDEIGKLDGEGLRKFVLLDFRCKARIAQARKPTVAAIQADALGGGLELALACDVRFASATATFGFPEIERGTVPGSGGIQRLPAIVGRGIATDLLLTGRKIDAQEAWRIGLINYVCEPGQVLDTAHAYALRMAKRSSVAVQGAKSALQETPLLPTGLESAYHSLLSQVCRARGHHRKQVKESLEGGTET